MQVKKQQLELDMEQQTAILSPCLFNFYAEYIMWNAGLEEAQAGIKIAGRNINNLRYADSDPYARKRRGTREPPDEGEREGSKAGLKLITGKENKNKN